MKEKKYYSAEDKWDFGRYEGTGKTIGDIISDNPQYIRWCLQYKDWFYLAPPTAEAWARLFTQHLLTHRLDANPDDDLNLSA